MSSVTVILGAGFSKNSGIPVQAEIPQLLVKENQDSLFENSVSQILNKFIKDVYGYNENELYPNLDDIFTCMDISTNSGHHLGFKYSAVSLRSLRRFLVYRVFSVLENSFVYSGDVRNLINSFFSSFERVSFVVLNWDTILENYILSIDENAAIDYCNGGSGLRQRQDNKAGRRIKLLKVHGSANWLYCDNCRSIYYDLYNDVSTVQKAGFKKLDFELFDEMKSFGEDYLKHDKCKLCGNDISSHIATFSYRKTFRANSFANIWKEAEEVLTNADKWIFIGYSLPDADYEFKHLLKISQLKLEHMRKNPLSIDVVLLNSEDTISKYQSFFGNALCSIYNGGISEYIIKN